MNRLALNDMAVDGYVNIWSRERSPNPAILTQEGS